MAECLLSTKRRAPHCFLYFKWVNYISMKLFLKIRKQQSTWNMGICKNPKAWWTGTRQTLCYGWVSHSITVDLNFLAGVARVNLMTSCYLIIVSAHGLHPRAGIQGLWVWLRLPYEKGQAGLAGSNCFLSLPFSLFLSKHRLVIKAQTVVLFLWGKNASRKEKECTYHWVVGP